MALRIWGAIGGGASSIALATISGVGSRWVIEEVNSAFKELCIVLKVYVSKSNMQQNKLAFF